jgi:hypothetical protein
MFELKKSITFKKWQTYQSKFLNGSIAATGAILTSFSRLVSPATDLNKDTTMGRWS